MEELIFAVLNISRLNESPAKSNNNQIKQRTFDFNNKRFLNCLRGLKIWQAVYDLGSGLRQYSLIWGNGIRSDISI